MKPKQSNCDQTIRVLDQVSSTVKLYIISTLWESDILLCRNKSNFKCCFRLNHLPDGNLFSNFPFSSCAGKSSTTSVVFTSFLCRMYIMVSKTHKHCSFNHSYKQKYSKWPMDTSASSPQTPSAHLCLSDF